MFAFRITTPRFEYYTGGHIHAQLCNVAVESLQSLVNVLKSMDQWL